MGEDQSISIKVGGNLPTWIYKIVNREFNFGRFKGANRIFILHCYSYYLLEDFISVDFRLKWYQIFQSTNSCHYLKMYHFCWPNITLIPKGTTFSPLNLHQKSKGVRIWGVKGAQFQILKRYLFCCPIFNLVPTGTIFVGQSSAFNIKRDHFKPPKFTTYYVVKFRRGFKIEGFKGA